MLVIQQESWQSICSFTGRYGWVARVGKLMALVWARALTSSQQGNTCVPIAQYLTLNPRWHPLLRVTRL